MGIAKRAYGREDKEERREVILAAATELFRQGHGDLPSVADIATAAGLAKGTVYLYFPTKETIFAVLLLEGWGRVLKLVDHTFPPAATGGNNAVEAFLSAYVTHLDGHRELLRLDALRSTLELKLEIEALIAAKQTFHEWLSAGGALVDRELALTPGRGLKLLTRTYALTVGLWQSSTSGQTNISPELAALQTDFAADLSEALVEYWRGALAPCEQS
jgi:AcrR family transcriptional regulator